MEKDRGQEKPAEEEELREPMAGIEIERGDAHGKDDKTEDQKDPSVLFTCLFHEGDHPDQEVAYPHGEIHPYGQEEAMGSE